MKGTRAVQQYQSRIRVSSTCVCISSSILIIFCNNIVHAKWFVLIIEFPAGYHLEMWLRCIAVPDPTLVHCYNCFYQEYRMALECRYVTFQDGGLQEIQWSKQIAWRELYTEKYQIWAADVDTSWGKLLFEINIVGQPRFPLRALIKMRQASWRSW